MALDRSRRRSRQPRSTSSSPIQRWVTSRTRDVSRSKTRTPASTSSGDELRRGEARAGDVGEDDVRLDRLRAEATPGIEPRAGPTEGARAPVVVRDAARARVQGDERRRRGDSGAVDARSAETLQHRPAPGSTTASLPASTAPNGAERPLLSDIATEFAGAARRSERDAERAAAFTSRAPSRWTRQSWRLAAAASASGQLRRQRRPAGARVRVLEHEQRRPGARRSSSSTTRGSIRPSARPDRRPARAARARRSPSPRT